MPELKISPLTAIRDLRGMRRLQGGYTAAIDAAITALEYRIPQNGKADLMADGIWHSCCPECGNILEHDYSFCPECGQHIKPED